jgi:hypothetical protein
MSEFVISIPTKDGHVAIQNIEDDIDEYLEIFVAVDKITGQLDLYSSN